MCENNPNKILCVCSKYVCVCMCMCIWYVKKYGHDYEHSVSCRCVFERMMDVTIDMRRGESFLRAARYFRINLEVVYAETWKREEFVSASQRRKGGGRGAVKRENRQKKREGCRFIRVQTLIYDVNSGKNFAH